MCSLTVKSINMGEITETNDCYVLKSKLILTSIKKYNTHR